jgi:hypothetical protein
LTPFQGLKKLKELKEETGDNHSFINTIKGHLSELQKERMRLADLKDKELFYDNGPPL